MKNQKLLLASSGSIFEKLNLDKYFDVPLSKARVLWITTASHKVPSTDYLQKHLERVQKLGLNYREFDIKGKSIAEINKELGNSNIVHMEGGNTFYLLKTIRETGFDKLLRKHISQGLNYIGTSAGSYIMGPSIITATWSGRGFDKCGVTDFTALNYVPFVIKAHYGEKDRAKYSEYVKNLEYPLKILTDEQAIFVQGENYDLIGKGEEVVLK